MAEYTIGDKVIKIDSGEHGTPTPIVSQDPRTLTHWRVLTIECGDKSLNIYPDGGFINGWTIQSRPRTANTKFYTNDNTDASDIIELRRVQDVKFDVDVEDLHL